MDIDKCPGRFKCHGPVNWCPKCGDVDLICDDSRCDQHMRGSERYDRLDEARGKWMKALAVFNDAEREFTEAQRAYKRWLTGNPVMTARVRKKRLRRTS